MFVNFAQWGLSGEEWEDFRLLLEETEELEQTITRSVAFWKDLHGELRDRQLSGQLFLYHTIARILHGGTQTVFSKRLLLAFGLALADLTASRLRLEAKTQAGITGGRPC